MEVIAVRTRCMGTISAQHAFIYHEMSKNMWCVCFVMHFLCYAVTFFSILCNTDGNIFHIYNIYGSDLSVANKLNNLRGMIFWKIYISWMYQTNLIPLDRLYGSTEHYLFLLLLVSFYPGLENILIEYIHNIWLELKLNSHFCLNMFLQGFV